MKLRVILIFCLLLSVFLQAQNSVKPDEITIKDREYFQVFANNPFDKERNKIHLDSLKNEYTQITDLSKKIDVGLLIAEALINQIEDKDSILPYLSFSLTNSVKLSNQEKVEKYIAIGKLYGRINSKIVADSIYNSALRLTKDPKLKAELYLNRNSFLQPFERFEDCNILLDSAKIYLDKISNKRLLGKYYRETASCYLNNSQILEGLNFLLKAEELTSEDNPELPGLLTYIGSIYDELGLFDKTLENGLKAQELSQKSQNISNEIVSIYAIISGAFALHKFDLVKDASNRMFDIMNDDSNLGYIYFVLGKTALAENQANLSIDYFEKALSINESNEVSEESIAEISEAYEGLSMAYFKKDDFIKAGHFANLALEYEPPYISDRTLGLTQIIAKNNQYKRAYKLLEKDVIKKAKQDSLNNPSEIMSLLLTDNFEQQKLILENKINYQKQIGKENLIRGLGVAIIAFLVFLFFYIRRKNKFQKQKLITQVKEQTQKILEQKNKLQELNIAKSKLYTNITHEFRTPLTVISGIAGQLEGNSESKILIQRNSDQLLNLINQMLDLRKIESGEITIQKTQGDIIKFLRYLTESLKSYAELKELTLHFLSEKDSLLMDFDDEKITRIHSNLLSNAIKFTPKGGDIYLQLDVEEKGMNQSLILKIKDTGVGISKEELPRIFDRFYQVDDSSTRKGEGTGIGLTLVSELIKAMDGDIKVSSTQGKGTTFSIILPITNSAELAKDSYEKIANTSMVDIATPILPIVKASETKNSEKPVALIVEDNPDVIHYLINCLKEQYTIEIAMNGEEGIENAIENIPDIIVSDVMMPIKDGFELCQTLKTDERTSHIPIILLTAKADIESRLEGLQKGADAYLSKPFHQEELLIILQSQLVLRKNLQVRFSQLTSPITSTETTAIITENNIEIELEIEDAFLRKIRDIIEQDLSNSEIGIQQLVRKLGMSRSQIFKKVKALTGNSPSIYMRSIRLYHAQKLLKTTDYNVSEVAYKVGFTSPAYFSNVYFEEFGTRPNETLK